MCVNPVEVHNRKLGSVYVPCRQCYDCRKKRGNDLRFILDKEIQACAGNAYFLTLTYNDDHCPRVYVYEGEATNIELNPYKASLYWSVAEYYNSLTPRERAYIDSDKRLNYCREFTPGVAVPSFSVESKRDVQKWLKRCRVYLSRHRADYALSLDLPERQFFKYAIVGEYGGLTFRPHFHAVICSSVLSPEMLEHFCKSVLAADWQKHFGRVDFGGLCRSSAAASTYISKYIYKPDSVANPYEVFGAVMPPPKFHSIHFGERFFESLRPAVEKCFEDIKKSEMDFVVNSSGAADADMLHFFTPRGGVCNLRDYYEVFSHKLATSPLFQALERLYTIFHSFSADGVPITIPIYYIKRYFPRKSVTHLYYTYGDDSIYSYHFDGYKTEVDFPIPPRVVDYCFSHVEVLDTDNMLYRLYTCFVRVRYVYAHFADLSALLSDTSDLPFSTFQEILSYYADSLAQNRAQNSLSAERKHSAESLRTRLQYQTL